MQLAVKDNILYCETPASHYSQSKKPLPTPDAKDKKPKGE